MTEKRKETNLQRCFVSLSTGKEFSIPEKDKVNPLLLSPFTVVVIKFWMALLSYII